MTIVDQLSLAMDSACELLKNLPIESMEYEFVRRATVAIFLLAPLCAVVGLQVVNFRLAFFADAVSHSAFTGIGLGLVLATLAPILVTMTGSSFAVGRVVMIGFGLLVALAITWQRRNSSLSSDTIIGVFSSAAVALGLLLFSNNSRISGSDREFLNFLRGNVLSVSSEDLLLLAGFCVTAVLYVAFSYNRLLITGLNADLAEVMSIRVWVYEFSFSTFLALLVMFCIPIVGALVVTAMLVIPAAAARNFATSAGTVFWWAVGIAWVSGLGGFLLADQFETPVGATIVLCNAAWFALSQIYFVLFRGR